MNKDINEVLIDEETLKGIVKRLGKEITRDYEGKNLFLITILKGAVVFLTDLMRSIECECRIDFMVVSSYGASTKTTGNVKIVMDINQSLEDKDVLIVEDILDSGYTLNFVKNLLLSRNPKSLEICTLLDKPERRAVDIKAKYIGMQVPDAFVVGYGLDYDEKYRNLPYIGVLKTEVYRK